MPTDKAIIDVVNAGTSISIGEALPYSERKSAIVVGTKWIAAEFITTNRAISFVALSGFGFIFCSLFIASSPSGVAAFPRPKKFAVMFIAIASFAFLSLSFGKINFNKGDRHLQINTVNPLFCAIAVNPFQRQITPDNLITKEIASVPPVTIASESSVIFPVAIAQNKEKTTIIGKR